MIKVVNSLLLYVAEKFHQKFFHQPLGDEMRTFLRNLRYFILAIGISSPILAIVNISAGRFLGPAEYGKYTLVISVGQFMIIPMLLGLNTAIIKYAAGEQQKKVIVNSGFYSVCLFTLISLLLFYFTKNFWMNILEVDNILFLFMLLYSSVLTFQYLSEAILRGLQQFFFQSILEIIKAIMITLIFFGLILFSDNRTFQVYVVAVIAAFFLYAVFGFWFNRDLSSLGSFQFKWLKKLFHYGIYALLGGLSGFILRNIDRIMIYRFLGPEQAGIYAVYFSASSVGIGQGLQIFLNIFFPTVSKNIDRKIVLKKLNTFLKIAVAPIIVFTFFLIWGVIYLYGEQYPKDLFLMFLFAINTGIFIIGNIKWWLIASIDVSGVRFTAIYSIIAALINLGLNFFLIQIYGLVGAILATIAASIFFIVASAYYFRRMYSHNYAT